MSEPVGALRVERGIEKLHADFLAILPKIQTHARICFRHLRCPGKKEDAVAEVVAVSWKWYLGAVSQGKDANEFASTLADFAARHVRSGRKLCGQERSRDVLSPVAQQRHGFNIEPLNCSTRQSYETLYGDPHGQDQIDAFEERLKDNTVTPPPEQAAFRIDFPAWLKGLGPRNRKIARDMTLSHSTRQLALKHRISEGRVSQLRRELHQDWQRFHGEPL
jgi:hypothetical protein